MFLSTNTGAQAQFSRVPTISHSRNSFSIAKKHTTTIQFDKLYPIYTKFMNPGDTINISLAMMARLGTQVGTLYDDLYIDVHAWDVPFRLIQTNWARFQYNAQPLGPSQDNSSLTSPSIDLSGLTSGFGAKSLYDYLQYGDPEVDLSSSSAHINNYEARAYNLIHNENYRDQNLQTPVTVDLDEGPDDPADYVLLDRGKRHDKFTSALTAQQKGTAVTLPLGTTAPIERVTNATGWTAYISGGETKSTTDEAMRSNTSGATYGTVDGILSLDPNNQIYTDLASAIAPSLNLVRTQFAIQQLLEADARSGTRDVESVKARWGVTIPDSRVQRPEFCGASTFTFDGVVVPQTSESGTTPQGTLKQFSQSLNSFNITKSTVENSVLMILISARSNITYQQGLSREKSYQTRYDFFQPEFGNLGEVAIKNKEIYFQGTAASGADDDTFGYQEYGYELRYADNIVSGEMRSNYATSKDYLHMADDYSTLPVLNAAFIKSQTPITRNLVVSTATADPIELSTIATGKIARTLPMYSVPGLDRL